MTKNQRIIRQSLIKWKFNAWPIQVENVDV